MTLAELGAALRASWAADTADHPDRELLGGEILVGEVQERGERIARHAWNRLPDGREVDFTREQFDGTDAVVENPVVMDPPSARLRPDDHVRLLHRVLASLLG